MGKAEMSDEAKAARAAYKRAWRKEDLFLNNGGEGGGDADDHADS